MNLPILKYLDVVIGLAVLMVILSTVVLAITQTLLNLTRARPRHLQRALERLIVQIDPQRLKPHAAHLAALVVRHPLVARRSLYSYVYALVRRAIRRFQIEAGSAFSEAQLMGLVPPYAPASVIRREELTYLLIELASGEGPLLEFCNATRTDGTVAPCVALREGLVVNGVEDPSATLRAIQRKALENERADPAAGAMMWKSRAVIDSAQGDFVAKLFQTFDGTIARASDSFGVESQLWVTVVSLLLALFLRLDSFALLKRLSVDESARAALVSQAKIMVATDAPAPGTPAFIPTEQQLQQQVALQDQAIKQLQLLNSSPIDLSPPNLSMFDGKSLLDAGAWAEFWSAVRYQRKRMPGFLFSWILLSLGTPFWYDLLKNALKLRSVLAKQDDDAREKRQGTGTASGGSASAPGRTASSSSGGAAPVIGGDEAGDLAATGATG